MKGDDEGDCGLYHCPLHCASLQCETSALALDGRQVLAQVPGPLQQLVGALAVATLP
jgi:hypothetical protein